MASRASKKFVCTSSKLHQHEQQHDKSGRPPIPPTSGYAGLTNRALIAITGVDSTSFLQGMITQNMLMGKEPVRAPRRTGSYSAFLNSQGRVLHDVFIYPITKGNLGHSNESPDEAAWLIEVDKAEVSNLMKHLKKHKLRAKLTLRALEDGEQSIWAAWNNESTEPRWAAYNLESDFPSQLADNSPVVGCIDTRAPGFGTRYITPGPDDLQIHLPAETKLQGLQVDLETYKLRRYLYGVAEGQGEIIRESSLPMECNMDVARGIDFRKGCYVGQELTIRTHHTGVVRKRILPVQLYGVDEDTTTSSSSSAPIYDLETQTTQPPTGANISRVGTRKGRSAGKFISGVGNVGLALCRLEMMTDISLTGESSQYNPSQEFQVSWDAGSAAGLVSQQGAVKIKAIVPSWLREYIVASTMRNVSSARAREGDEGLRARDLVERLGEEEAEEK
ncbi:aminomethyl transferase, putative [Talaromyces stipitatus ATCC 10500]|uniref:Iron-sulfur cluster assembly factor IBA57 homolog, mitochondrial n=1 Tax=Talaromyces stipitatus (strain ATCC 10500 / CBS 375.48 / QM 6759 / NRRL 1006) TaxID=441959 RepID=B8M1L5_TALSN|nr:aminomethyl transferase, putative [Talaromyces stipitatus ATCC 10500]EED22102.1 aminomethyl transferase, putative [Talaromyces stipitatus ATCC 10500]